MDASAEKKQAAVAADANTPAVLADLAERAQAGEFDGALLLLVRPDRSVVPVVAGSARDDQHRFAGICLALAKEALDL